MLLYFCSPVGDCDFCVCFAGIPGGLLACLPLPILTDPLARFIRLMLGRGVAGGCLRRMGFILGKFDSFPKAGVLSGEESGDMFLYLPSSL